MNPHTRHRPGPIASCAIGAAILSLQIWFPPAAAAAGSPHVVLTSPVQGATWVHPETGLLFRFDLPLAPDGAGAPAVRAVGSLSGVHAGRSVVADGGRALIFRPAQPFARGETVVVNLAAPRAGQSSPLQLTFSTSPAGLAGPTAAELVAAELEDPAAHAVPEALPPSVPIAPTGWTPPTLAAPGARTADQPPTGSLYLAAFGPSTPFLAIVDTAGYFSFYRPMSTNCFDFKMQPDGTMTYFADASSKFFALDSSYTVVDSIACGNSVPTDLHELRVLSNGHYLLLGLDYRYVDMSQIVPGGNPNALVIGAVIQELDRDKNVVFEWRSFDHFAITDATHENLTAATIDYVHANALEFDNDGNILLSSRHMDEITKIDRNTGDIVWRLGGLNNQFTFVGDPDGFSHQHAIRRIANGDITLFDNGNFHSPQYSRGVEYALDEVNKTATLVWQYRNTPDIYGFAMGYVERLTDGSTLISYGTGSPDAIQVGGDGSVTLTFNIPGSYTSYRIVRDPAPLTVGVTDRPPAPIALSNAVPNPFREQAAMFLTLPRASVVTLQLFDVAGRKVLDVVRDRSFTAGTYRFPVDLAGAPAGVYFAQAVTNAGTVSRRLVHVR